MSPPPEKASITVYTDGASRGNPGQAAIGYVVFDSADKIIEKGARCIGRRTNNEAEYEALLWAMDRVLALGCNQVRFYSDSELMVRQINGQYRTRDEQLKALGDTVRAKRTHFARFKLTHVKRENAGTQVADDLVNQALDRAGF